MALREMIVSAYTGDRPEDQVDPFLRHLLGRFSDELSEADRLLLEYTSRAGLPDLYFAMYDDARYELRATADSPGIQARVSFGREPRSPGEWRRLREALSATLNLSMEIDS